MVRTGVKMPNFCLNRIRPHVRFSSPPIQFKPHLNSSSKSETCNDKVKQENCGEDTPKAEGRRIMIVVDTTVEAKNALNWALTHTIQSQDSLILLYVTKPCSKKGEEVPHKVPNFLLNMKNSCILKRPEVEIEVKVIEGKEKGPTIVAEAKKEEVGMLIIGQKKKRCLTAWRLLMMWSAALPTQRTGVVEYCVNNANCMAIAVRKKSNKAGGYLITTKHRRDFWLLA